MLNYAIFDLDGTVLDSMDIWREVDKEFMRRHSLEDREAYFEEIKGLNFMQCAVYTIKKFNLDRTPESLMDEWDAIAKQLYTNVAAKPGAVEFIKNLHEKGVKLGVATSNYESLYKGALINLGIYDLFDSFTETHNSKTGKSTPAIYLEEAEKLGAAPEYCAVFEDILTGVRSAKSGGFTVFAVADRHSKNDEADLRKEAHFYTYNYSDIDISLFGGKI